MWVEEKQILQAANIVTGGVDAGLMFDAEELQRLRARYEKQPQAWHDRNEALVKYANDLEAPFPPPPALNEPAAIARTLK